MNATTAAWTKDEREQLKQILNRSPILSLADLRKFTPDPRTNIAGNRFLERGHLTLLTAELSSGKSTWVSQIAVHLATGTPLVGRIKVHGRQKVLLLAAESSEDTLKRDFESIAENLGVREGLEKWLGVCIPDDTTKVFTDLNLLLKHFRPDVLIMDPYLSFTVGCDVNGIEDAGAWRSEMTRLIREYDCALLLATHTKKPERRTRQYPEISECVGSNMTYKAFGSVTIPNWARIGMELTEITPTSQGERQFVMNFSKALERTGLRDDSGRFVQYLQLKHSRNPDKPLWSIADPSERSLEVSWKNFFDVACKAGGGLMPSLDALVEMARTSKVMKSIRSKSRSTIRRVLAIYEQEKAVVRLSEESKRRYYVGKKMGDQSPESAKTGAGVVAGVRTDPPSASKRRGRG